MKNVIALFVSIFMIAGITSSLSAQAWSFLGSAKVHGVGVDHDEIIVTGMQGEFSALKLFVENEGIEFERVVVHFGNGGQQELVLRDFIPAGGETRVMDLTGRDRVIRTVDFYYKSNPLTKRKGKVKLYGRR